MSKIFRILALLASVLLLVTPSSLRSQEEAGDGPTEGVMIMAHGGDSTWNRSVAEAVTRLRAHLPVAVAFGMASPPTLRAALDSLAAAGVDEVAVVRLFISGRSFRPQTDYLLGIREERPRWFMVPEGVDQDAVRPISHGLRVRTHDDGLMSSQHASRIVRTRALDASVDQASESVLLIAHGMADEEENAEVVGAMAPIAEVLAEHGFAAVETATLREDWPAERAAAEARIRAFVSAEAEAGRRVIVVPFRLSGFGPYASVLDGLDYVAAEGLLPHTAVSAWIVEKAAELICGRQSARRCSMIQP